ncbi:MAG TPA: hypothetical protein VGB78_09805 [Thermoplasmata archaeon]
MAVPDKNPRKLDEVLRVLSGLKGVRQAFFLSKEMRCGLERIERDYPSFGPLTVRNDGVQECLRRAHVACMIKDAKFRPPPQPTVLLVDSDGSVIGHELLPGEKAASKDRKTIFIGKDFVMYYEKGRGKGAKFVLPPIPFEEVERIDGVSCVCSASPCTVGDLYLRKEAHLEDDPKLASILVGFDLVSRSRR